MLAIEFGGWLFISVAVLFLVTQAFLLTSDKNGASLGVLAAYCGAVFLLVDDWPQFNYRWLIVYPALGLLWLPVYWYLDLLRRASRLRALLVSEGSLQRIWQSSPYLRNDLVRFNDGVVAADIKHPAVNDLFANCLLFPVSIPLFFGENFIRTTIDYLKTWMEEVRKTINKSING